MDQRRELEACSEAELACMFRDTGRLAAEHSAAGLSSAVPAAVGSNALADNVEFWKWMGRNYQTSGIFSSPEALQNYIAKGTGKAEWVSKQLQGKGYEWDWMRTQRVTPGNMLNTYDAGDVANRAASDVTERNILTGKTAEYQMKAYTSKKNPDLHSTPKDMTVVTNAEKAEIVRGNGYQDVQEFEDAQTIRRATDRRMEQARTGRAQTAYTFQNVAGTMARAGLVGCVVGMGAEAVSSYRAWKQGALTDEAYLREILKAGGDAGVTAGVTAGLMIPVSAAVTAAGASTLLTIPVAFVLSPAVNKIVAPCFGRGEFARLLSQAQYYQNLEAAYGHMLASMQYAGEEFYGFVCSLAEQKQTYRALHSQSRAADAGLERLLESI